MDGSQADGARLFSGQWAETATQEALYEHEDLYCEGGRALNRLPREVMESPGATQTHLDALLCNLL